MLTSISNRNTTTMISYAWVPKKHRDIHGVLTVAIGSKNEGTPIGDGLLNRLIVAFLKSGVMSEAGFHIFLTDRTSNWNPRSRCAENRDYDGTE